MIPQVKLVEGRYPPIVSQLDERDLRALADVKRFIERYVADGVFRRKFADDPHGAVKEYGLRANPDALRPMRDQTGAFTGIRLLDSRIQALCDRYDREMTGWMMRRRQAAFIAHPRYRAWWQRQVARNDSELSAAVNKRDAHVPACFELSKGCSVGCWFCGIAAEKFEGPFPYTPANAHLWRETLEVVREIAGPAAETSICYWATDPFDNPDYESFVADFHGVMGVLPATTTAVPHKDLARTRAFLGMLGQYGFAWNRFSILTPSILDRVHAEFTPEELVWTGMDLLTKESLTKKSVAGRAREQLRKEGKLDPVERGEELRGTTIACVTGFLFNMVERRVKLISPCRANDRWPLGYRIYDEGTFADGKELRALIEAMIATHMPESLRGGDRVRFRGDLRYEPTADGFVLATQYEKHAIRDPKFGAMIAALISRGTYTLDELRAECGRAGMPEGFLNACVQALFDAGMLDDEPDAPETATPPVRVEFSEGARR